MNFYSIYSHGFVRVAACTIVSSVADPSANAAAIVDAARACHEKSVAVAAFPELCLSGYAMEDLLLQDALLDAVERGLAKVVEASTGIMSVLIVGAPLRQGFRTYNCAVAIHRGRVLGVVPKTYLPTYREFYEARHFGSGKAVAGLQISIGAIHAPFGTDLLFEANDVSGLVIGIEICEDKPIPRSLEIGRD
ncbi:putative amidohydrolase [Bradyrhizobium sp. URHC0002]